MHQFARYHDAGGGVQDSCEGGEIVSTLKDAQ